MCVEAFFLIGCELVGERSRGGEARESAQKGQQGEEDQHVGGWCESLGVACRDSRMRAGGLDRDEQWSLVLVVWSLHCCSVSSLLLPSPNEDTHASRRARTDADAWATYETSFMCNDVLPSSDSQHRTYPLERYT
jgi:hypothetical protein